MPSKGRVIDQRGTCSTKRFVPQGKIPGRARARLRSWYDRWRYSAYQHAVHWCLIFPIYGLQVPPASVSDLLELLFVIAVHTGLAIAVAVVAVIAFTVFIIFIFYFFILSKDDEDYIIHQVQVFYTVLELALELRQLNNLTALVQCSNVCVCDQIRHSQLLHLPAAQTLAC